MPAQRVTLQAPPSPRRLDEFLREALPPLVAPLLGVAAGPSASGTPPVSNSKIRRLIVSGAVTVNGRRETRPSASLAPRSAVAVGFDPELFAREKRPDDVACEIAPGDVLFEDALVIAVNKPAGIPTEATVVGSRDHLHAAVGRYLARTAGVDPEAPGTAIPYVGLHHRLDRETSGVILFTKDPSANAAVHALFLGRGAKKTYHAIASLPAVNPARKAIPLRKTGDSLTVENLLARVSPKSQRARWGAVSEGGAEAKTAFTVLAAWPSAALLECEPFTGRTHQIRVHLAGLGMPILGDPLYGGAETGPGGLRIPRVMLHAASLAFPHPGDGREITVTAPRPPDFEACLESLGAARN